MRSTKVPFFACTAVLAFAATAFAQQWGRGREPRDGACFYENINYGGQ